MRIKEIKRPAKDFVNEFRMISTSILSDAMDKLGLQGVIEGISPIVKGINMSGPVITVKGEAGMLGTYSLEDFRVGAVLEVAQKGDVIVFDIGGRPISTWGGLASTAAKVKGIEGVIVDGGVRDISEIRQLRFPTFTRHIIPTSGKTRIKILSINTPVRCSNRKVLPGDIVVGDDTGLVVIPIQKAEDVLKIAKELQEIEEKFDKEIKEGGAFAVIASKYRHM